MFMHATRQRDRNRATPRPARAATRRPIPHYGRFLQPNPIGYGDGMNPYAYVGNDPVNSIDPTGLTCTQVTGSRICLEQMSTEAAGFAAGRVGLEWGCLQNCGTPSHSETHEDGNQVTVVEAPVYGLIGGTKWLFTGTRYVQNPHWTPSPYSNRFDVATGILFAGPIGLIAVVEGLGVAASAAGAIFGPGSAVFRRGGLLNNKTSFRLGWGPAKDATRKDFWISFGARSGQPRGPNHKHHFDVPGTRRRP